MGGGAMNAPRTLTFTVPGRLPGLNEATRDSRGNRYGANKAKHAAQACITPYLPRPIGDLAYPVSLSITWHERDNRRDVDNICHGVKYLLDAMVAAGLLHGDGRRYVRRITHDVVTDRANPRIEVEVREGVQGDDRKLTLKQTEAVS